MNNNLYIYLIVGFILIFMGIRDIVKNKATIDLLMKSNVQNGSHDKKKSRIILYIIDSFAILFGVLSLIKVFTLIF